MFLFYVLSFFKKGDTIQGGTLFKGGYYLAKEVWYLSQQKPSDLACLMETKGVFDTSMQIIFWKHTVVII